MRRADQLSIETASEDRRSETVVVERNSRSEWRLEFLSSTEGRSGVRVCFIYDNHDQLSSLVQFSAIVCRQRV